MGIEYTIYASGSTEQIAANLFVDAPLPHIEPGNSLVLQSPGHSPMLGHHLEIRHVEVYVFAPVDAAAPQRVRVSVFTRERDRIAIPKMLRIIRHAEDERRKGKK